MSRPFIFGSAASAAVMIALPWGLSAAAQHDAGMAFAILLFFVIDPLWSVLTGIFSARDPKHLWPLPLVSAGLFVLGAWITYAWLETDFLWYAAVYTVIGMAAMGFAILISRHSAVRKAPGTDG